MNNAELLNLMNLLRSIRHTQEKILEELKNINNSPKVNIEEIESTDPWTENEG